MTEPRLLWISVVATGVFAAMGITWGIASGSGMIVFDGLYSLVSLGLSMMSLLALKEIAKGESERFPFGKSQFEPMLVAFKSVTIIGMCLYAAADSVMALFDGGRDVALGSALVYAMITTGGSLAVALLLMRHGRRLGSALIDAEKNQWLGDTLLSLCVLIAFGVAFAVLPWSYPAAIPYVDPAMVVIASCLFLALPARSLLSAFRELLFMRADDAIADRLEAEALAAADHLSAKQHKVHVIAIGRQLEVEVNFLLDDDRGFAVTEMDAQRQRFIEVAKSFKQRAWVNMNITRDASQL
ncbi:MAG: cation transporter [Planctomycetota bacterium]